MFRRANAVRVEAEILGIGGRNVALWRDIQ
jgi:hypothetical protein